MHNKRRENKISTTHSSSNNNKNLGKKKLKLKVKNEQKKIQQQEEKPPSALFHIIYMKNEDILPTIASTTNLYFHA